MADEYRESLSLDVSNFLGSLNAAQVALGTFAGQIAGHVAEAIAGFAGSLVDAAREVGKATEAIENLSAATGISEVNLMTLDSVMRVVGGSVDSIGMSMRLLARNMQEADQGNIDMQRKLAMLGITSRDVNTAMRQVADTMVKYKDDGNKVALASEVLGRGFAQLLPAIKDGSKSFDEGADRAALLGTAFDFLREEKIKAMDNAFDVLKQSSDGLWKTMVGAAAPAIAQVATAITELNTILTEFFTLSDADLMEAHWIRLGALLKSIASDVSGVLSGKLFSLDGIRQMNAAIEEIEKERDAKLAAIHKRNITKDPKSDTRGSIGTPGKIEDEVKALEARHKLELEGFEDRKKIALADAQFEKLQIKERVSLLEVTAMQALEMEAQVAAKEIRIKQLANDQKLKSDEEYFRARIKLAGSPEERAALQAQADAVLSKNKTEGALLDRQQSREGLANILKQNAEIEAAKKRTGDAIVQNEASVYKISQDLARQELEDQINLRTAVVAVRESELRSYEDIASAKMDLLLAQFDLEIHTAEEAGRETVSITAKYAALLNQENERMTNGFVRGWQEGLSRYTNDTSSMFGMAVDMARSTAQMMQQAFQQFFFDLFSGKIQTLKDVLRNFLDFVKQIMSQVMATLVSGYAMQGLRALIAPSGGVGGLAGPAGDVGGFQLRNAGGLIEPQRFSFGGPVLSNGDSVPALLTPGEFVVSRTGVETLNRLNQGQGIGGGQVTTVNGGPVNISITVNAKESQRQSGGTDAPNFSQLARQLSALVEAKIIDEQRPGGLLAGGAA